MMRGILQQETAIMDKGKTIDDERADGIRQQLQSKEHKKNATQKKDDYLMKKKFLQSRV